MGRRVDEPIRVTDPGPVSITGDNAHQFRNCEVHSGEGMAAPVTDANKHQFQVSDEQLNSKRNEAAKKYDGYTQSFPPAKVIPGLKFEPLWDGIVIQPIAEEKSSGGLVLPQGKGVDDIQRGRVVAIGPGIYKDNGTFVPVPLDLGDIVYRHARTHASRIRAADPEGKDTEYLILNCRDIVCVERVQPKGN